MDGDFEICKRCGCCEVVSESCEQCGGEGLYGHDCGEDVCCCLEPDDDEDCPDCGGAGFFKVCAGSCNHEGKHDGGADAVTGGAPQEPKP